MSSVKDELFETSQWEIFTCRMPLEAYRRLEDQLERVRDLADIDPDDRLPQEVKDGLALELIVADFAGTDDESVI